MYGLVFLEKFVWFKSRSFWFDDALKLNSFGFELKLFPIKYGNTGDLYPAKGPEESAAELLIVAKYTYAPFGYSGVTQNLPLFLSNTVSSETSKWP